MPIRAVLWDVDDTLFDFTTADEQGFVRHVMAEGLAGGSESAGQALGRWQLITVRHWQRFADGAVDYEGQRRDRVREFLGEPLSDAEASAWFHRYVAHYEAAWALFPDASPAVAALAPRYRQGVLSNASTVHQERKLRTLGLRDHFEVLLCAAELGVSKPAAGAFLAGCAALGLPPGEVAYVGDQPEIDARGADEAGLFGIWLDRRGTAAGPDIPSDLRRIIGLAELPALLAANTGFGAPSPIG
ncbi:MULTISPECIES: HAD family hydrolase [unclassified Streptomyces]|uniref:HAD family hydrolase n=1 Tax=unclassified Streptomyces TaxID=2593676 RepID=UPI0020344414|nr:MULTISPECIES: HAD family hydrolase [unclassified Streptomyces]MCM2421871.1 HAD family hydrolase [Streptomyces sp. RKAG293]MCM2425928.1 HAD family hydrolase [Streptomyces sp. RKAG337]